MCRVNRAQASSGRILLTHAQLASNGALLFLLLVVCVPVSSSPSSPDSLSPYTVTPTNELASSSLAPRKRIQNRPALLRPTFPNVRHHHNAQSPEHQDLTFDLGERRQPASRPYPRQYHNKWSTRQLPNRMRIKARGDGRRTKRETSGLSITINFKLLQQRYLESLRNRQQQSQTNRNLLDQIG